MTEPAPDWDPIADDAETDQLAAYDHMRATCPVAYGTAGDWAVFKHADAVYVLDDIDTFSNAVSQHVAVPNGMDPPEHTSFRTIVDRYYTAERMTAFEPTVRAIAADLVAALPRGEDVEVMASFAEPYANRAQCAFMGWPESLREPLQQWTKKNHAATHARDRDAMSEVAVAFDAFIREQLDIRRTLGARAALDLTTELLRERVNGRRLTDDEIVSIVRNWTVGELATLAASVGIILEFLATHPEVQAQLRADVSLAEAASDEILRMRGPLIANRRRTTRPVTIGEREVPAGQRLMVMWVSVNRDEDVFGDPDEFRPDRDPALNLLYGRGIHSCPGAPLARLELRVIVEELFAATAGVEPALTARSTNAIYPASGFTKLPLRFR